MTEDRGLISVKPHPELWNRYETSASKGIAELIEKKPFSILVWTFSNQCVYLPKWMHIAIESPAPDTVYESKIPSYEDEKPHCDIPIRLSPVINVLNTNSSTTEPIKYRRHDLQMNVESIQIIRLQPEPDIETITLLTQVVAGHKKASLEIEAEGKEDWRTNINISDTRIRHRKKLDEVLEPFADIWDGHLDNINGNVYRIELKPNSKQIFQNPYSGGSELRKLEKDEIDKMLRQDVIESACCKWAPPSYWLWRRMTRFGSVSTTES